MSRHGRLRTVSMDDRALRGWAASFTSPVLHNASSAQKISSIHTNAYRNFKSCYVKTREVVVQGDSPPPPPNVVYHKMKNTFFEDDQSANRFSWFSPQKKKKLCAYLKTSQNDELSSISQSDYLSAFPSKGRQLLGTCSLYFNYSNSMCGWEHTLDGTLRGQYIPPRVPFEEKTNIIA